MNPVRVEFTSLARVGRVGCGWGAKCLSDSGAAPGLETDPPGGGSPAQGAKSGDSAGTDLHCSRHLTGEPLTCVKTPRGFAPS